MIKDYSNIPANKRIVNDTKEDITISLRDKCIMVPVKIKVNDSLSVKATTSEDLALINKQCEDYKLILEDEGPDITDIVVTITPNIREGESNSKANAIIATLNLKGGTEPVIYSLDGADANKFILENNIIKAKNNLTEGIYTIIVSAIDATKETYSETDKVTVLKAYPLITDANISFNNNIREGETNSLIGSNIGTIQVVGGTSPYTIKLTGNNADKLEIVDNNIKAKQNLTEGEYNITFNITDKNNKTFKKTSNFSVLKAFPLITNIETTLENNLREGELNTKANAQIGSLRAIGGTTPITFTLQGTHANKFVIEGNNLKIGNTNLTQGSYSISIKATDKNNKTFTKALNINVLEAFPLITSVRITKTNNLREGEANVNKGALVANFQVVGGTAPFTYSLTGTDASKFILDGTSIKVGNTALTAKTYSISIHVQDTNNKIFDAPTTIEVLAAYPAITNVTLGKTPDLREGEDNVNTGATVATLTSVGGTQPFTYTISGTDASSFVIAENKLNVRSNPLTAKTYSIEITSTDKNNKTKTVSDTIVVQAAYPEITSFTVSPTGGLEEGNANVQADAIVATMSVEGGSAPITYSLREDASNGVDNASFKVDGSNLKVNTTPLTTKAYKVALTATDTHGKIKNQNATISVAAPNITSLNAQLTSGLEEGNENVAANAKIADLSTTGGIAPYTYSLNTDEVNGVDNANFKVEGTQLKVNTTPLVKKDYKVSLKVTDKNNKTATKNITVSVGTPAISALNITPVESLQAPLAANTVVANLTTVGGIAPYTYSLKANTQDNAEFIIDGNTVKNKANIDTNATKNITIIVTDKNSKTKEQTATIEIAIASV